MNERMEIPKAFDWLFALLSGLQGSTAMELKELLSELFLPPSSKNNLVKEHLACQPWSVASLLLWPLFFSSQ